MKENKKLQNKYEKLQALSKKYLKLQERSILDNLKGSKQDILYNFYKQVEKEIKEDN